MATFEGSTGTTCRDHKADHTSRKQIPCRDQQEQIRASKSRNRIVGRFFLYPHTQPVRQRVAISLPCRDETDDQTRNNYSGHVKMLCGGKSPDG